MTKPASSILKTLAKIGRKALSVAGWLVAVPLIVYGSYAMWRDRTQLKPVEIITANPVSDTEGHIDRAAHAQHDAYEDMQKRFARMLNDPENDSIYRTYAARLDAMDLKTVARKAFVVDSIVDADIGAATDYRLYGEDRWATPVETLMHGRGDGQDKSILKDALLDHLKVPTTKKFLSVADKAPNARSKNLSVMVDTSSVAGVEYPVILDPNDGAKLTSLSDKNYGYHIGINKEGIRYITPPVTIPKKDNPR